MQEVFVSGMNCSAFCKNRSSTIAETLYDRSTTTSVEVNFDAFEGDLLLFLVCPLSYKKQVMGVVFERNPRFVRKRSPMIVFMNVFAPH